MAKNKTGDVFDQVLLRLEDMSFGFPKSYFRFDRALIKNIFTKEDATDYLKLSDEWITPTGFAEKNGCSREEAKATLDRLAEKGFIFRRHREEDEYRQFPFVMGILEWQIKNTNKMWLLNTSMYMISSAYGSRMSQTMPFYRTVPMHTEFVEGSVVAPYDNIDEILNRHTRFAVADCICRTMYKMKPFNPCHHPLETCIETDDYATYFIETGIGREITREEAKAILLSGEKDGRVINVCNSKEGENICSCCKCGCGMLYLKTKYPGPSGDFWSNHYAECDNEKCVHCGLCLKRCPFGYISKEEGKIVVDKSKCLGCGICVGACRKGALRLYRKEEDKLYTPPDTYEDAMEIWKEGTVKDYKRFK